MALPNWATGALLSFGASQLTNLGLYIQRKEHENAKAGLFAHSKGRQQRTPPKAAAAVADVKSKDNLTTEKAVQQLEKAAAEQPAALLCSALWLAGVAVAAVGCLLDLCSLGFVQMSFLAPVAAVVLVINLAVLEPCATGKGLQAKQVLAAVATLAGVGMCLTFGDQVSRELPMEELLILYRRPAFLVYGFLVALGFVCLLHHLKKSGQGFLSSYGYSILAGICGAHSVLYAKCGVNIALLTRQGHSRFLHDPFSRFLPVFLVCALFSQLRYLNKAFSRGVVRVIPVYQLTWVVMNYIVGLIYFEDFRQIPAANKSFYALAIVLVIAGMYGLVYLSLNTAPTTPPVTQKAKRTVKKLHTERGEKERDSRTPVSRPAKASNSWRANNSPGMPSLEYLGRMGVESVVRAMAHTRAAMAGSAEDAADEHSEEGDLDSIPAMTPLGPLTTCPSPETDAESSQEESAPLNRPDSDSSERPSPVGKRKNSPVKFDLSSESK